ncbi:dipeptidase PepE [Pseudonocardia spinosispora]|uniref:dipeptidase PepE n=1 Tax=Pseudonocardia spinosispora TaxID=103441 RepID=UPI000409EAD9|nr:dipeptidase PepE [Pseudonocardia spinosispora]
MDLLLLSNSTNHGQERLGHVRAELREFYGDREVLFVPYALADHDAYTAAIADAFAPAGVRVRGVHTAPDPASALAGAQAVFVGGGNTFRLLRAMRRGGLLDAVRSAVHAGARYGGASAGTNLACPSIRTTNDMPIVDPGGFDALGLIGFQINPHYLDSSPDSVHMGETRAERIGEFLEENDVPVLGLREGAWLRIASDGTRLHGRDAVLFSRAAPARELPVGTRLTIS